MSSTIPGLPADLGEPVITEGILLSDVFSMYYRKGNDVLNLQFQCKRPSSDCPPREHFRIAVERAKRHCDMMRYKFLWARPFVVDLDEEEKRMPL